MRSKEIVGTVSINELYKFGNYDTLNPVEIKKYILHESYRYI